MRIAAVLATFLVASFVASAILGSAASLTLTGTKLGSNTTSVAACDSDGVSVSWTTAYDSTLPGYKVSSVTVSGIDVTNCAGATLNVTLVNASGTALGSMSPVTVSSASHNLSVTGTVNAQLVEHASVVITGP